MAMKVGSAGELPTTRVGAHAPTKNKIAGGMSQYGFSGNVLTNIWNYGLSPVGPWRGIATTVAVVSDKTGDETTQRQAEKTIYRQESIDTAIAPYGLAVLGAFLPVVGVVAKTTYTYGAAKDRAKKRANDRQRTYSITKDGLERIKENWFSYGWGYGSMFAQSKEQDSQDEELIDDEDKPPKKWLKKQKEKEKQRKQQQKDAQESAAMAPFNQIFPGASIPKERNSIFTLPYTTENKEQGKQSIFSGVFTDRQAQSDAPSGFSGTDIGW